MFQEISFSYTHDEAYALKFESYIKIHLSLNDKISEW